MNPKYPEIPEDILRFIAILADRNEKLTPEQQTELQTWLNKSPLNLELFNSLKELWSASKLPEPSLLSQTVISEMMDKIESLEASSVDMEKFQSMLTSKQEDVRVLQESPESWRSHGRGSRWTIWTMRAAALVVLSLSIFWLQQRFQKNRLQKEPLPYQEFTTANAQKMQLRLSDGSLVYLNAASQIRVPTAFSRESREIYMQGEAFFKVAHGASPFVVNTALGKIKDIGTEFNVRVRGHQLQVVVAEGEVALYPEVDEEAAPGFMQSSADLARLPVSAGQMAGLSALGKLNMPHQVDVEGFLAWRKDVLVFKKTPLAEVLQELTRQYDVDFRIRADLNRHSITAQFKGLTSDQVLSKLSLITDLTFQRDGQTVLISEQ